MTTSHEASDCFPGRVAVYMFATVGNGYTESGSVALVGRKDVLVHRAPRLERSLRHDAGLCQHPSIRDRIR